MQIKLSPILTDKEIFQLMALLRTAKRVAICGHYGPDGDAVGAALGWAAYLKHLGKQVTIVMPNPFPDFLTWLPGSRQILFNTFQHERVAKALGDADLICCLDFRELGRIKEMATMVERAKAKLLVIDHHLGTEAMGEMMISHPEMSSTSEMVLRLIDTLGAFDDMPTEAATALYTGMMTDTGGFTYNSNNPEIYLLISMLLSKGINKDKIYRNVYWSSKESRLRIIGYVLHEKLKFYENHRASIFTLTRQELKNLQYVRGDSEGLVNMPLEVKGMRLSISLREDTEKDVIRVSLRSVDDFPCNKMASEFFNGGGHLNASGGELPFPMEDAIRTAERAIEAYRDLL